MRTCSGIGIGCPPQVLLAWDLALHGIGARKILIGYRAPELPPASCPDDAQQERHHPRTDPSHPFPASLSPQLYHKPNQYPIYVFPAPLRFFNLSPPFSGLSHFSLDKAGLLR